MALGTQRHADPAVAPELQTSAQSPPPPHSCNLSALQVLAPGSRANTQLHLALAGGHRQAVQLSGAQVWMGRWWDLHPRVNVRGQ